MDNLKQNIRKWNHDILTHMIGITYLMDMQRYPEAERYCAVSYTHLTLPTT